MALATDRHTPHLPTQADCVCKFSKKVNQKLKKCNRVLIWHDPGELDKENCHVSFQFSIPFRGCFFFKHHFHLRCSSPSHSKLKRLQGAQVLFWSESSCQLAITADIALGKVAETVTYVLLPKINASQSHLYGCPELCRPELKSHTCVPKRRVKSFTGSRHTQADGRISDTSMNI